MARKIILSCDGMTGEKNLTECCEVLRLEEEEMCSEPHTAEWDKLILKALRNYWTVTQNDDGARVFCEECTKLIKFPVEEDQ